MERIKFFYDNYWDENSIAETSEHTNFPAENTQHRDHNKCWHSNHGAGSGWGAFYIGPGFNNNKLDFEETAGIELTATITTGEYDADTLAAEIETQLEAAGASDYTVTYSDVTNKFTLASDRAGGGGTFKLLWNTGTNAANSIGGTIGFDVSADDNDAASHEADYLRIHGREKLTMDFGYARNVYAVIIRNHNFQAGATVNAQFSTDNFATTAESISFTIQDDILVLEWDTPKNYRYFRIWIEDEDNPDGYVKMGRVFCGSQFQPTKSFRDGLIIAPTDPSFVGRAEDGQIRTIQRSHYELKTYSFLVNAQKVNFDTMFDAVGTSKGLFICDDPSAPLTTTFYAQFTGWEWSSIFYDSNIWDLNIGVEELR